MQKTVLTFMILCCLCSSTLHDPNIILLWKQEDLSHQIGFNYTFAQQAKFPYDSDNVSQNSLQSYAISKTVATLVVDFIAKLIDESQKQPWKPFQHVRHRDLIAIQSRWTKHKVSNWFIPKYYQTVNISLMKDEITTQTIHAGEWVSTYPEIGEIALVFDSSLETTPIEKSEHCCMNYFDDSIGVRLKLSTAQPVSFQDKTRLLQIMTKDERTSQLVHNVIDQSISNSTLRAYYHSIVIPWSEGYLEREYFLEIEQMFFMGALVYLWPPNVTRVIPYSETLELLQECIDSFRDGEVLYLESTYVPFANDYLVVDIKNESRYITYIDLITRKPTRKLLVAENSPVESEKFWVGNLISQGLPAWRIGLAVLDTSLDQGIPTIMKQLSNGKVRPLHNGGKCSRA
jgi:hypothetical protein